MALDGISVTSKTDSIGTGNLSVTGGELYSDGMDFDTEDCSVGLEITRLEPRLVSSHPQLGKLSLRAYCPRTFNQQASQPAIRSDPANIIASLALSSQLLDFALQIQFSSSSSPVTRAIREGQK